ncbi:MAG TPA: hypothetical protein ACFYD6_01735 [Candidatus Brocadiia bacterium]|nr:hypothetical protein [Planctomycetota bacterium]MDO8092430.1 hypothetical protein [Candidatus Brocadiales bacterium]
MSNKVRIKLPDGREVDATPIDINQASEQWNHCLLEDGSVLRIKLIITKVFRIDDEYDAEGNPVYIFQSTNVTSITSPESLKRKI